MQEKQKFCKKLESNFEKAKPQQSQKEKKSIQNSKKTDSSKRIKVFILLFILGKTNLFINRFTIKYIL